MSLEQAPHKFVPSKPSPATVFLRRLSIDPLDLVFPSDINIHDIENRDDGWQLAHEYLKKGWGLVVLINHFSIRDPVEVLKVIVGKSPIMVKRQILGPIAYHHYSPPVNYICGLLGIELRPIVTEGTIELQQNDGHAYGYGLNRYATDAITVLKYGGIVLLAPQTTRKRWLRKSRQRTVEFFIRSALRNNLENVAYMFVGLGAMGVKDYGIDKVGGLNFLRNYSVSIGSTLTQGELVASARENNMSPDVFVYAQLAPLVPEAYRGDIQAR